MNGLKDAVHGLDKSLDEFGGADLHRLWQAVGEVASLDLLNADIGPLDDTADAALELLGSTETDEQIVLAANKLDDGLIEAGARDLDGLAFHHAAAGDHCDLRRAAADVDDHVPVGLGDVNARAHGGGNGGLQQVDLARARLNGGVDDGALLHAGDGAWHTGQHAGFEEAEGGDAADKLAQHLGSDLIVRDDAGVDRMNGHDVGGGAAQHFLGVLADLQNLAAELVHCHDGGFPGHNALALLEQQRGRGAQVDSYISLKQIHAFSP